MTRVSRSLKVMTGAALVVLLAGGVLSQTARAFNPQPDPPAVLFGMTGITRGQVARLTVSYLVPAVQTQFPPDPCRVALSFVDMNGDTLMNANGQPVETIVTLRANHSAFLQISGDDFVGLAAGDADVTGPIRANIRPVALVLRTDGRYPPGPCVPSLEILDSATGRTLLHDAGIGGSFGGVLPAVQRGGDLSR